MRRISATESEQRIAAARKENKARPVRAGCMPPWMCKRVRDAARKGGHRVKQGQADAIMALRELFGYAMDHIGSAERHDGSVGWVNEPYDAVDPRKQVELADELGCSVEIGDRSWHSPGFTVRIEFFQSD